MVVGKPNLVKCFGPRLRLWTWTLDFVPGPSFSIYFLDTPFTNIWIEICKSPSVIIIRRINKICTCRRRIKLRFCINVVTSNSLSHSRMLSLSLAADTSSSSLIQSSTVSETCNERVPALNFNVKAWVEACGRAKVPHLQFLFIR